MSDVPLSPYPPFHGTFMYSTLDISTVPVLSMPHVQEFNPDSSNGFRDGPLSVNYNFVCVNFQGCFSDAEFDFVLFESANAE